MKRQKMGVWAAAVVVMSLGAACSGDSNNRRASNDAGEVDAGVDVEDVGLVEDPQEEPGDLGEPCNLICNLSTCVDEDEGCEGGVCVSHQELGGSYCSRLCVESCAPGYSCQQTEDESGPACVSNSPECGNGTVEFGEVCDGEEGCAEDCLSVEEPVEEPEVSGGTMTMSLYGNEPQTVSGDAPAVRAELSFGRLFFSSSLNAMTFGMDLPVPGASTPLDQYLEIGLVENVGGANCAYDAATMATISAFDAAEQTIAGSAEFTLNCQSSMCGSECSPTIDVELEFDLRWVEVEE
ncbi:hypothetical protein DV096_19495 [Bradymonadaceae bacterium TMQ3]|nr:hypothetical protein DV096_19495 [Bradymonadaceae bacterium TMQ3]TXC68489.1 hypothetical protein FRC91_19280 [Bradymonadales bacterium TMQ1]